MINSEPEKMNSVVRDADGHRWRRMLKFWKNVDGPGRLPWVTLKEWYGPLVQDAGTDRLEDDIRRRRAERRHSPSRKEKP